MPSVTIIIKNSWNDWLTNVKLGYKDSKKGKPDWRELGSIAPSGHSGHQKFHISTTRDTDLWRITFEFQGQNYESEGGFMLGGWKQCDWTVWDYGKTETWEIGHQTRAGGTWFLNMKGPLGECKTGIQEESIEKERVKTEQDAIANGE